MKRSLLALALLTTAGVAAAQTVPTFGILNGRGAAAGLLSGTTLFPGGLGGSAPFFLAGNTVAGFASGRNGFSSFVVVLTENTPRLDSFATGAVTMFNKTYDTLLPLYVALDGPLMQLAAPAAPLLQPVGVEIVNGAQYLSNVLNGPALRLATLPGLEGMSLR